MFNGCSALKSLPADFKIPTNAIEVRGMFKDCTALEELPAGFCFKGNSVNDASSMFAGAKSLKALPEGFSLPSSATILARMFEGCNSLQYLPESIDLTAISEAAKTEEQIGRLFLATTDSPVVTYYAGTDVSKITPSEGFWTNQNRELYVGANQLPVSTYKVTYQVQDPATTQPVTWMTMLAAAGSDGRAYAKEPLVPSRFGYVISEWRDASTGQVFDFSQPITSDLTLMGAYDLVIRVDVPLQAKVEVDASGIVTPAAAEFVSHTPVALKVAQVAAEEEPGAAKLFPNAAERAGVETVVKLGRNSFAVPFGGGPQELAGGKLDAATPSTSAKLPVTLSLELNGAQIDFQPGEDITSFAKLIWTVEAA